MRINEIHENLENVGYIPTKEIDFAVSGAINQNIPLLIEGAPGCGKTSLAKAVAKMLNVPMYRVQFYEGLTADKILYDYDYQRQLLTIQTIQTAVQKELKDKNIQESIEAVKDIDFYGEQFLIKRPVLNALTQDTPCVLLLDEIDKASEELEYTLLEVLDEFSMTIPQFGTVKAECKPIIFLTSNNYRTLSDALKRRCNYLYIENKTKEEMLEIIKKKAGVAEKLAMGVAECLASLQEVKLRQTPSIDEAIKWAQYLEDNFGSNITDNDFEYSLCALVKNKQDLEIVKTMKLKSNFE